MISVFIDLAQSAQAQRLSKQIHTGLAQPRKGQQLLVGKIENQSPEVRPVLDGGLDIGREWGLDCQTGDWTFLNFGLVFGYLQTQGRQIKHLAPFVVKHGLALQRDTAALTARTAVQRMHLLMIGFFDRLQGVAGMAGLAAGFAPGLLAQVAWRRFGQSVAGGRFAAVGAVESQTFLEFANFILQVLDLLFAGQKLVDDRLWLAAGQAQKFLSTGYDAHRA